MKNLVISQKIEEKLANKHHVRTGEFGAVLKTGKQVFLRMIEKITELTLQRNGFYLIQSGKTIENSFCLQKWKGFFEDSLSSE